MCFRHFDRGSQTNFHLPHLTGGTALCTLGNTFNYFVDSCNTRAEMRCVSAHSIFYYHSIYKMECPWPKASKCTRAVLNLSWRLFFFCFFFFFKAKEIQYVFIFFFHFVYKHICSEAGWGQGWFSSCCPEPINEFYFKKNWKPLECMRSFNLQYKMH